MSVAGAEGLILNDVLKEGDVGLHSANTEFAEGTVHALAGGFEVASHGGELHQHGVIVRSDDGSGVAVAGVEADAVTRSRTVVGNAAVVGCEAFFGIFGGDTALDSEAIAWNVGLRGDSDGGLVKFFALGDENLGTDKVNSGDTFGYGVFNLNAGVHFDEEPLLGIHVVEEFHGSGIVVSDIAGEASRRFAEFFTEVSFEIDGRSNFDDLLVSSLDGAITLMEVHDVTVSVAENLHLDVLGALDVALQEDGVVSEGIKGFFLGLLEAALQLGRFFDDAHSATAATEGCLDDEREPDFVSDCEGLVGIRDGVVGPGKDGDIGGDGLSTGRGFVTHGAEEVGRWSDEGNAFTFASAGEVGIFGEETVSGVDQGNAFGFGESDNAFVVEIGSDGAF